MLAAELRKNFIRNEVFLLSWSASVQHNKVYSQGGGNPRAIQMRRMLEELTFSFVNSEYASPVGDQRHLQVLQEIKSKSERDFNDVLHLGLHKIGTVQKQFNLLLKYYWCLGKIPAPPHCPIDRIVLDEAGIKNVNWTDIQDVEVYEELVGRIREAASGKSLAEWELETWQRRFQNREDAPKGFSSFRAQLK